MVYSFPPQLKDIKNYHSSKQQILFPPIEPMNYLNSKAVAEVKRTKKTYIDLMATDIQSGTKRVILIA